MTPNHHSGFDRSFGEALDLHNNGQIDEAIKCYEKALAIKNEAPEVHNSLGNIFLELGQNT